MYDFDRIIERRGTNCVKYDAMEGWPADTIPLFVADMDFASPPAVRNALAKVVEQEIYGYTVCPADYFDAVRGWYLRRFGWEVQKDWLLTTPGVVHALNMAVRAFTDPGDEVLILTPVYGPFYHAIVGNGRTPCRCPLILRDGRYEIDFASMERLIRERGIKLFLHCSPHNPVGRVWSEEEQRRIGRICTENGTIVVADEIHSDFVFPPHKHTCFAALSPDVAERCVVCTAPSKTFNLAGLQNSNIFIPSKDLRRRFADEMAAAHTPRPGIFAYAATVAAYREGDAWVDEMLAYLQGNRRLVEDFLAAHLPQARLAAHEGTYLLWLDLSAWGSEDEVEEKLRLAGIRMNRGSDFCTEGGCFFRMNIATTRANLGQALARLARIPSA